MPELVKLYKNLRDFQLGNMLYKTKEGLQKDAFDCRDSFLLDREYEYVFAIYDEDSDDYFIIRGGHHSKYGIGG
ncbi:hypothetical protein KLEP7_gp69 [Pseudaeromonas phage vB_PpeM_ KLEP7]|nr:hypothetical protein KLEP7_gp69 [Pseudaeromonas phage vB_PpeM_ KLEP7]